MKLTQQTTEDRILAELGERLAARRLERDLTQEALAARAGIGLRTLQRLEKGAAAAQLSSFVRVCQALDLIEALDRLIPSPGPSPIALLKLEKGRRRRASRRAPPTPTQGDWSWAE